MKLINLIISCFVLLTFNAFANEGVIISSNKYTDWSTDKHWATVEVEFPTMTFRRFTLDMNFTDIAQLNIHEGGIVTILQELPDLLVGDSIFKLSIEGNERDFETKGKSITLTKADWGLDDQEVMITEVTPNVTIDGNTIIQVAHSSGTLLGNIFRFTGEEQFDPNDPGLSFFRYVSLDGESEFTKISTSINSIWTPTEEQTSQIVTVYSIGMYRDEFHKFHSAIFFAIYPYMIITGRWTGTPVTWTKVGNRFIKIRYGVFVDLDTRLVITHVPIRSF